MDKNFILKTSTKGEGVHLYTQEPQQCMTSIPILTLRAVNRLAELGFARPKNLSLVCDMS